MIKILPGRSFHLGARLYGHGSRHGGAEENPVSRRPGVNFSVYSKHSTGMELLLFDHPDDARPSAVIPFDPNRNRTDHYWHVFVPGLKSGQLYAYRAHGAFDPNNGLRFDPDKILLDPYGRGVVFPANYSRGAACVPGDNTATAPKSVIVDPDTYHWEGDLPLYRPFSQSVIYEMHVSGFTKNPNSGLPDANRGTYQGLIEKIPYLKELGVTAVELLPVYAFDPTDAPPGKVNYWGYTPLSFFAPHPFFSSDQSPEGPVNEFRDMVKALHKARIEVILDVVYNHTTEGNEHGPTLSFKGFENEAYYILEKDPQYYANYTGTGNTLNANHPIVRRMIVDSLRYWVSEMHVDGFRFDLASILSRNEDGIPESNSPILWDIDTDPFLAGTKIIAEAWDAAGLYQVGSFAGDRWKEWNGKFRDDVRGWVRGDPGSVNRLPARLLASPDIYEHENREPEQSVNFVACHDGFTLNDVVSYDTKHNLENGESNRDGSDNNVSWNHGVEGPTIDPSIDQLRERQVKNFFAITLLSMGTPMLLMGDEVRRTQDGNNNAYCQDNTLSWFDWSRVDQEAGLRRFVEELIRFRLRYGMDIHDDKKTLTEELREAKITWHGVHLNQPDWSADSRSLAVTLTSEDNLRLTHMIFNTYWDPLTFDLPPLESGKPWRRLLDTQLAPPEDICDRASAPVVAGNTYTAQSRSVVVLVSDI